MKINITKQDKVEAALDAAQTGCRARLLTHADLAEAAERGERRLKNLGVPVAFRKGCYIELQPERVANKYYGTPYGTFARLERGTGAWFLINVWRAPSGQQRFGREARIVLSLSSSAHANIPYEQII